MNHLLLLSPKNTFLLMVSEAEKGLTCRLTAQPPPHTHKHTMPYYPSIRHKIIQANRQSGASTVTTTSIRMLQGNSPARPIA